MKQYLNLPEKTNLFVVFFVLFFVFAIAGVVRNGVHVDASTLPYTSKTYTSNQGDKLVIFSSRSSDQELNIDGLLGTFEHQCPSGIKAIVRLKKPVEQKASTHPLAIWCRR